VALHRGPLHRQTHECHTAERGQDGCEHLSCWQSPRTTHSTCQVVCQSLVKTVVASYAFDVWEDLHFDFVTLAFVCTWGALKLTCLYRVALKLTGAPQFALTLEQHQSCLQAHAFLLTAPSAVSQGLRLLPRRFVMPELPSFTSCGLSLVGPSYTGKNWQYGATQAHARANTHKH
jgi:hypothetical protein